MTTKQEILSWFTDTELVAKRHAISKFIKNKEYSYEDRLEIWCDTPESLRTVANYLTDIKIPLFEERHPNIEVFVLICDSKHQEVDLTCVTDSMPFDALSEDEQRALNEELMSLGYHAFIIEW